MSKRFSNIDKRADSKRTPEAKQEDKRRKDMRRFKNENRGKY